MSLLDTPGPANGEPDYPRQTASPLRKVLPYTTVLLVIAILYIGYTFYSRHQSDVEAQARLAAQKQEAEKRTVDAVFGNGEIKFTTFYIDTRSLKRGDTARLCYGVVNATSVKIDPPVEQLKPTYEHCFEISPTKTTKYTITAEDGKGHSKSESLELPVH